MTMIKAPTPKLIGRLNKKEAAGFRKANVQRQALNEATEVLAAKLAKLAEKSVKLQDKTWDLLEKRMGLNLKANIYHVDDKTGEIFFDDTRANIKARQEANNPLARLFAGAKVGI